MRLIDADALTEKKYTDKECSGCGEASAFRCGWNDAIDTICENAPTIKPKTKMVAQVTFDEDKMREIAHETVERFKEEYDIVDNSDAVSEWIPCSERLPETLGEYLITALSNPHKNRITSAGYYNRMLKEFGTFKIDGSWEKWDVIAWMPKPEPYMKELDK